MNINDIPYLIVQAGGMGTRLKHYTFNKPKCLLSVGGEPLLYRLFRQFPKAHFIIIGDYLFHVLERYLDVVPPSIRYTLIRSHGTGTLAGMKEAINQIKDSFTPFHIVWSDLFFDEIPDGEVNDNPVIGLSRSFLCSWSLDIHGRLVNLPSSTRGVAGFFCFPSKRFLRDLPSSGEFVRYISAFNHDFTTLYLDHVHELGSLDAVIKYNEGHPTTRYFNVVKLYENVVVKYARDSKFEHLIEKEASWYEKISQVGFKQIPRLISRQPLMIERIKGFHVFEINTTDDDKRFILDNIVNCLTHLHNASSTPANYLEMKDMYYQKTIDRVSSVQSLIPNINEETLNINNTNCRNPFHPRYEEWFRKKVETLHTDLFTLIHGDPTFSNILIDEKYQPWLIDPRGYFAKTRFYGDKRYDWAKLYYSVLGNYDQFNRKRFRLKVNGKVVNLDIQSNGWESQSNLMREWFEGDFGDIELLHALIWISLSGYVKDDLDSILASFYNGLYWLERTET